MKKTIIKEYCDDCGKESNIFLSIKSKDFCENCVTARLKHDLELYPLESRICKNCKGTAKIKEYTGIGNDYNYIECGVCRNGLLY